MMFRSVALSALLVAGVDASFEKVADRFTPLTSVTDHSAVSVDQTVFEAQLKDMTQMSFAAAKKVYVEGGNSKSVAAVQVTGGLPSDVAANSKFTGRGTDGSDITLTAYTSAEENDVGLQLKYGTSEVTADHLDCRVGGLPVSDRKITGCLVNEGTLIMDGSSTPITYKYDLTENNFNERTLQGFSTKTNKSMRPNGGGPYFKIFQDFVDYYGTNLYADKIVMAALEGTDTPDLAMGRVDISSNNIGFDGRVEVAKKGTAYLNTGMYVLRELYDAIDDCNRLCKPGSCNDDSAVHALDEAVVFYHGTDDNLYHNLAQKRCANFGTCDNLSKGYAKVNSNVFDSFNKMQSFLQQGECAKAQPIIDEIAAQMWVPLIQGTLRYAWSLDSNNNPAKPTNVEKAAGEGAIFAAGILPVIHKCSEEHAKTIYENMRLSRNPNVDFPKVKAAFEACYSKIGITCEDVGSLLNSEGSDYDNALTMGCGKVPFSSASSWSGAFALGVGAVSAIAALVL